MMAILNNRKGKSGLGPLIAILLVVAAGYVGLKLGEPYFAYMNLVKTMEYWADYDIKQGDTHYTNLLKNVQEEIDDQDIQESAKEAPDGSLRQKIESGYQDKIKQRLKNIPGQ